MEGQLAEDIYVYNSSVHMSRVVRTNFTQTTFTRGMYSRITLEGSLTTVLHSNLHKTHAYRCTPVEMTESSETDLVISKDGTSVRFGELTHMTHRGTVVMATVPSTDSIHASRSMTNLKEAIGDGLGLCHVPSIAGVNIYKKGNVSTGPMDDILVIAPNFTPAAENTYHPLTRMRATPDMIEIGPGGNIHVKGSMVFTCMIDLDKTPPTPLHGWYCSLIPNAWFQAPITAQASDEQTRRAMTIATSGDTVISRGYSSVLLRPNGCHAIVGPAAVVELPVYKGGTTLHSQTAIVFQ